MADRKDRMALLSRYNKLHLQRYEQKSNLNLNVEQWASDALVESYGLKDCYDLLDYYFSVAQEPSLVRLPDQSLFCVMRTCTGYIWWSQSLDDGESWCSPRPLLHRDFGLPLMNPVGPDPIYQLSDG